MNAKLDPNQEVFALDKETRAEVDFETLVGEPLCRCIYCRVAFPESCRERHSRNK